LASSGIPNVCARGSNCLRCKAVPNPFASQNFRSVPELQEHSAIVGLFFFDRPKIRWETRLPSFVVLVAETRPSLLLVLPHPRWDEEMEQRFESLTVGEDTLLWLRSMGNPKNGGSFEGKQMQSGGTLPFGLAACSNSR
jgi:hypothetical protein